MVVLQAIEQSFRLSVFLLFFDPWLCDSGLLIDRYRLSRERRKQEKKKSKSSILAKSNQIPQTTCSSVVIDTTVQKNPFVKSTTTYIPDHGVQFTTLEKSSAINNDCNPTTNFQCAQSSSTRSNADVHQLQQNPTSVSVAQPENRSPSEDVHRANVDAYSSQCRELVCGVNSVREIRSRQRGRSM